MSFIDNTFAAVKSIGKIIIQSRPLVKTQKQSGRVIVMGNGPSLADTIRDEKELLASAPLMGVNFAAIAPEFFELKPEYYVLADPHFFKEKAEGNLELLRQRIAGVDWEMCLYVPAAMRTRAAILYSNPHIRIATFNPVGVEGFAWLENFAFSTGLGMPRPRNVLIPALMIAINAGFSEIIVVGADHTWMKTLSVTDDNEVVSIQPHFYSDGQEEQNRIRHEYRGYRLHTIVESFAVAFRSYHAIANFAQRKGVKIINATPGSFIDAFRRMTPAEIIKT